jgi:hypothetical protein
MNIAQVIPILKQVTYFLFKICETFQKMSSLDDWSPPVSPSLIAAMEVNVIPETCPSQIDGNRQFLSF